MNIYRIELINRLRATESRIYSPMLSKLLCVLEDSRVPDIEVNRIMLDMLVKQDGELVALREQDINRKIREINPDSILIPRSSGKGSKVTVSTKGY